MKRASLFIVLALLSSSAAYGMEKGKEPAITGLMSMADMAVDLEEKGSSSGSPMSITAQLAVAPYTRCYFTPNIKDAFLQCISQEQKGMRGAFYRFTLYDVAKCIVEGIKQRKISVNLVIDGDHFKKEDSRNSNFKGEFCSPLKLIIDNDGSVYAMNKPRFKGNMGNFETMHQKFMIFESVNGKKLLWQGSWNATGQASSKNSECVMVVDAQDAIKRFEKEYETLLGYSDRVTAAECITKRDTEESSANFARDMNGIPRLSNVPSFSTVPPLSSIPPLSTVPPLSSIPQLGTIPRLDGKYL